MGPDWNDNGIDDVDQNPLESSLRWHINTKDSWRDIWVDKAHKDDLAAK